MHFTQKTALTPSIPNSGRPGIGAHFCRAKDVIWVFAGSPVRIRLRGQHGNFWTYAKPETSVGRVAVPFGVRRQHLLSAQGYRCSA